MESKYESLWLATSGSTNYPELEGDIVVDTAIVGGGIAGLIAAYLLTNAGRKVAVIEALKIVTGTSGFTTAKVTIAHGLKYNFLKDNFGLEGAKTYAESNQWAIDKLEEIVSTENIDCSFTRANSFLFTNDKKYADKLEKEYAAVKAIGVDASYVHEPGGLPFPIKQAIKFPNQAQFHPRRFLLALADIIVNRGGVIYESSRAVQVTDGQPATIRTQKGKVNAKNIILASNYPVVDKSFLFLKMGQYRSYAVAFKTSEQISNDMYIGIASDEFTVRTYHDDQKWVIVGGEMHHAGETSDTESKFRKLEKLAKKSFQIDHIDYRWSAQDASPHDRVPLIGKMPRTEHLYITTGFGEWGMSTSLVSAQLLTDLLNHRENPWQKLYNPARVNLKASLPEFFEMGVHTAKSLSGYLTKRKRVNVKKLAPGEAQVGRYHSELAAVYKDVEGVIHARSAVCTHMSCIVKWNNAEYSWDCPCHGSRFTYDGEVIHGPAKKPLNKVD